MCRNIRVLHHFDPPTTPQEIRAAAIQYVRKVSGLTRVPPGEHAAFEVAVDAVSDATAALLRALPKRGEARTREREREKGRLRWQKREARIAGATARGAR